jgi:hypothetical protein
MMLRISRGKRRQLELVHFSIETQGCRLTIEGEREECSAQAASEGICT